MDLSSLLSAVPILRDWLHKRDTERQAAFRAADIGRSLARHLRASWPRSWEFGPTSPDELASWAVGFSRGYAVTEPETRSLAREASQASRQVRRLAAEVNREYHGAADLVNPHVTARGITMPNDPTARDAICADLRRAFETLRMCVTAADHVSAIGGAE